MSSKNNIVYSLGCGDRFARQGSAQLQAYVEAQAKGINVIPVWNKSHREHITVHTNPSSVRDEADHAVNGLNWDKDYRVDADHINLSNVDEFIEVSDFFTIDVADNIGEEASSEDIHSFTDSMAYKFKRIELKEIDQTLKSNREDIEAIAKKYLSAVQKAGTIYRHIAKKKSGDFIVEVSMDETDSPQTPLELFFILAMIAEEGIPLDTIAPKFSGRFNKGVDYVGDVEQFASEFEQDLVILKLAASTFEMKKDMRLSVHSGSDKFSIYEPINRLIKKHNTGLHVKTAGTNWLEEVIGLAEAGGDALNVVKKIYKNALGRYDELTAAYASVIDINTDELPSIETVDGWTSDRFVNALRHDQSCLEYNPNFRQLIHVAYKVAYELGDEYTNALEINAEIVGKNVKTNLLERHIIPLFGQEQAMRTLSYAQRDEVLV